MPNRLLKLLLPTAFIAALTMQGQTPTTPWPAGKVLVSEVQGTATVSINDATSPLTVDASVPQTATLHTGTHSSVQLIFSNGTTLQIAADSELVLQEFLQEPFSGAVAVAALKQEPSKSRAILVLKRGDLTGNVKLLRHDLGSTFAIKTPVGVLDSIGGEFGLSLRPGGNGTAVFQLRALAGDVGFSPPAKAGDVSTAGGQRRIVPPGQEISLTVAVGRLDPSNPPPAPASKIVPPFGASMPRQP